MTAIAVVDNVVVVVVVVVDYSTNTMGFRIDRIQDPDPFDDRHPVRADPDCAIGVILKTLFKNENFINKLVGQYILDSK